MKSGNSLILFLCVAILLSLAGCAQQGSFPTETVEDIFNPTAATQETEAEAQFDSNVKTRVSCTAMSAEYRAEPLQDEYGVYFPYAGGDMHMPIDFCLEGNILPYGVGFYLFLDGYPQPYKLSEDGEYSYMHIVYPTSGEYFSMDFSFIPITGNPGETVWLEISIVTYPDYYPTNPDNTMTFECGPLAYPMPMYRIQLQADPPEQEWLEWDDHLVSAEVSYVDVTDAEVGGWTLEQLQTDMEYKVYVNRVETRYLDNFDPEDGCVDLRVEVWGTPNVSYHLVLAVNSRLATTNEEKYILFDMQQGKKAVIEATLALVDYEAKDYYNFISVILVPRNFAPDMPGKAAYLWPYDPIHIQKAKY